MDDSVFLLRGFLHVSPRNFQEVFPVRAVRQNYRVSSLATPQRTERVCPWPRCPLLPAHACSSRCFRRHVRGTRRVFGSPGTCVALAEQRPARLGKQMSQPSAAWGRGWYHLVLLLRATRAHSNVTLRLPDVSIRDTLALHGLSICRVDEFSFRAALQAES